MNTIPDLIPLHDNRPGLRSLLQVEVREPETEVLQKETKETKGPDVGAAVLDFVASTATLDRYHEVIEPAGWRLDSYRRNPVFQNAHNYGDVLFTLGKALSTDVRTVNGREALFQRIQFATEVNPVARIAYGLYKGGFLNAVSVGFIPLKWEDGNGKGDGRLGETALPRRRYLEQELLEVSAVAIPANPDALALGVKAGAVSKSDVKETVELLRVLVEGSHYGVPETTLTPSLSLRERGIVAGASAELAVSRTVRGEVQAAEERQRSILDFARELRRILRKA